MKTSLIQIGSSKSIRIPKSLIEQYHLDDQIELIPTKTGLLITASAKPRSSWEGAFKNAESARKGADGLAWRSIANQFDKEEWTWWFERTGQNYKSPSTRSKKANPQSEAERSVNTHSFE
jgi:antitoxin MazE